MPESQLDRFMMRLQIGYPDRVAEREILISHREGEPVDKLGPVLEAERVVELQLQTRSIRVEETLADYILDLVAATRVHSEVALGASPRAALQLYRAAQAAALLAGRHYVIPDDVKQLAAPVLAHRLLTHGMRHGGRDLPAVEVIKAILEQTAVPA